MPTIKITEPFKRHGIDPMRCTEVTCDDGETSDPVHIHGFPFTVTCRPSEGSPAGSGKLQFTTSLPSRIHSGTAFWQDWSRGVVSSAATDIPEGPVTAVRGVAIGGPLVFEVVQ